MSTRARPDRRRIAGPRRLLRRSALASTAFGQPPLTRLSRLYAPNRIANVLLGMGLGRLCAILAHLLPGMGEE